MKYQFDSTEALLSMGGHGPYVWSAYGISLLVMAWLVFAPLRRQRALLVELRARQGREAQKDLCQ